MTMTVNPGSIVDEEAFAVRRSIRIAAPIEKVWAAVTEPAHISRWFGRAEFSGTGAGATGTLTWKGNPVVPVRVEAFEPPRTVSYRWVNDNARGAEAASVDSDGATEFTFTLEEAEDGTLLTVVETGFAATSDPTYNLEQHRLGWNGELDKLVALLEGAA